MDETKQTTGAAVPTATKKKKTFAEQDQEQMNLVGEVDKCIRTLEQSAEALTLVAKRDVTLTTLAEGKAWIAAYQASFTVREQKLGAITEKTALVSSGWEGIKDGLTEFRETVRLAFPKDKAAQQALGATGKVPQDQEKFLILVRACAATAKTPGYAEKLVQKGYDSDAFENLVEDFASNRAALAATNQSAQGATAQRTADFKAVQSWSQSFYRALKLALKNRPDLLGPLGL
ncbi:MAG: hypothetical protein NTX57_06515 [Armatimonadetes bacterium]|nr:hypothetical protein [Armatimonadota bacterium]